MINDPEDRNDAGRRAKQRIQGEYLWEKVAAQVEQVYLDLYGGERTASQVARFSDSLK